MSLDDAADKAKHQERSVNGIESARVEIRLPSGSGVAGDCRQGSDKNYKESIRLPFPKADTPIIGQNVKDKRHAEEQDHVCLVAFGEEGHEQIYQGIQDENKGVKIFNPAIRKEN
ncbi:MAG: hypothetical protein LLF89_06690 [Spirochaetaceae bacterium]|nr:hypothetical protein [Spirochaetaceae bacterium]